MGDKGISLTIDEQNSPSFNSGSVAFEYLGSNSNAQSTLLSPNYSPLFSQLLPEEYVGMIAQPWSHNMEA